MPASQPNVTGNRRVILMPAFNEANFIGEVIADIRTHSQDDIIVIDDASADDTVDQAKLAGATVLSLTCRLGAWGALQTGLRYALGKGYDIFITMDADGQHQAKHLPSILAPVLADDFDVSIGACTQRGSRARKFAWELTRRVSGISIEDITSGFRVYNKAAARLLVGRQSTLLDYQDLGVLLILLSNSMRLCDVQVEMLRRSDGKSRIFSSWAIVAYYMMYTLILGVSKRGSISREFAQECDY